MSLGQYFLLNETFVQKKFFKFWFPVILYSVIIFGVSSIPNLKAPLEQLSFDKLIHAVEYMVLGILFARAFMNTRPSVANKIAFSLVVLFCFFYGFSDEFHQSFVAGRVASFWDLVADTIGGCIGGWLYISWRDNNPSWTFLAKRQP